MAPSVLVLHETLGGREDADAETVQHAGDFRVAVVEAAAGGRDAREIRDRGGVVDILELDDDGLVTAVIGAGGDFGNEAFGFKDEREAFLEFGVRRYALGETGLGRIAQAGQEVADGICHGGCC